MAGRCISFILGFISLNYFGFKVDPSHWKGCRLCLGKEEHPWHLTTDCQPLATTMADVRAGLMGAPGGWSVDQLVAVVQNERIEELMRER